MVFAGTTNFVALVAAGIVGVISTSGGEIGPFMAIEQSCLADAMLSETVDGEEDGGKGRLAVLLGWYGLVGYTAQALGALSSGLAVTLLQRSPLSLEVLTAYRVVFWSYGAIGGLMALLYSMLSPVVEAKKSTDESIDDRNAVGYFHGSVLPVCTLSCH